VASGGVPTGSVSQRADGRWTVVWWDVDGGRHVTTRANRRDAEELLLQRRTERARRLRMEHDPTVGEVVSAWLDDLDRRGKPAANARAAYRQRCDLLPASLTDRLLRDVDPMHIQDALDEILARPKKDGRPRSRSTVVQVRSHLAAAWRHARAQRWTIDDPVEPTYVPDGGDDQEEIVEVDAIDIEDAKRILGVLEGHRLHSMLLTSMVVGVRQGEAVGMRWSQVDLDQRTLRVDRQITQGPDGVHHAKLPKGRKVRTFSLPAIVADALKVRREQWIEEHGGEEPGADDLIWPSERRLTRNGVVGGGPIPRRSLRRLLHAAAKEAGLPRERWPRWHAMRHTAGTEARESGQTSEEVMDMLGHSSDRMVRRYQHTIDAARQRAAERIDARWS
jgi:integrase